MSYRYQGVQNSVAVRVETDQCCEPVCGPGTCGASEPEKVEPLKAKAADGCCAPVCGPDTCGG